MSSEPRPEPPGTGRALVPTVRRVSGTVFGPEALDPRARQVLDLRKRALPYDVIAEMLGITEDEATDLGRQALRAIKRATVEELDLARQLQVEQLEAMIAAIYTPATGTDLDGTPQLVSLDAIDRMVKLLDAKAKLLGLNAPTKIDIDARLVVMAEELNADVDELRAIANDVLKGYTPSRAGRRTE